MITDNKKIIIGYYNKQNDYFFCSDCFSKTKNMDKKDYKPIMEIDLEKDIYTCDKCGKKFEIQEEKKKSKINSKINEREKPKGCGCAVVIFFVIIALIILSMIFSKDFSSEDSGPNPEALYITCKKSCTWDNGYWKYTMWPSPPEYFLTRTGCIDYCERHIKSAY